ncbi:unknown [Clostridium sp. CAG:678]|nr:unknown [Clostridium sp. CAG:678]
MKVCPNCGKVVSYNSYFGGYICNNCEWINLLERDGDIKSVSSSGDIMLGLKKSEFVSG